MGEKRGTKGLELWCRRVTEGYPGVKIDNMTTSWRDGLAFCAIIHHFRPDLIDFSKLNKNDIYHNNELAFRIAEHHLGIPALLEPEDMVEYAVPDRLSILTYLSQFYQTFAGGQRIASKRQQSSPDHGIVSLASTSPPTKVACTAPTAPLPASAAAGGANISIGKLRREPCAKCHNPVFIAERLNVGKLLFHRTCFRCARCNSQLTLDNYYETENDEFCCETCPDEEKPSRTHQILSKSLSDEEKCNLTGTVNEVDDYSTEFESALEFPTDGSLKRNSTLTSEQSEKFLQARSLFMQTQMGAEDNISSDSGNEVIEISDDNESETNAPSLPRSSIPKISSATGDNFDSGFPNNSLTKDTSVYNPKLVSDSDKISELGKNINDDNTNIVVTKDSAPSSLVQARMRFFHENNEDETKSQYKIETSTSKADHSIIINDSSDNVKHVELVENLDNSVITVLDSSEENVLIKEAAVEAKEKSDVIDQDDKDNLPTNIDNIINSKEELKAEDQDGIVTKELSEVQIEITSQIAESKPEEIKIDPPPKLEPPESLDLSSKPDPPKSKPELKAKPDIKPKQFTKSISSKSFEEDKNLEASPVNDQSPSKEGNSNIETESPKINLEEYPEDLNPFGDDDEDEEKGDNKMQKEKKPSLNPFEDDEDEEDEVKLRDLKPKPSPRSRKKLAASTPDKNITLSSIVVQRISLNPFEEDEEEEEDKAMHSPIPASRRKKVVPSPRISLTPFWETDGRQPVPTPRSSRSSTDTRPDVGAFGQFESTTSLSSGASGGSTLKKKKPAPKPPTQQQQHPGSSLTTSDDGSNSLTSSPSQSVTHSPHSKPKHKKTRKAPLPPTFASTPKNPQPTSTTMNNNDSYLNTFSTLSNTDLTLNNDQYEQEKIAKDELNRTRQVTGVPPINSPSSSENSSFGPDKSTYGKWKKRKGQAPPRPIPQKRTIKSLPVEEVRKELDVIEIQLRGLERQGVQLETMIREKCEGSNEEEVQDESVPADAEDLIMQLFDLVNEKNELFRKQTELMYLRRQHRLEEEYADVEYQIRCIMLQPEANKTDSDKAKEEELINRLVQIVEKRNEIIDCLEMDRVREAEEDSSITNHINLYTLKREENTSGSANSKEEKKDKKKKKFKLKIPHHHHSNKDKEKKSSSSKKFDADKDIDEADLSSASTASATIDKKKKKKLLFL